MKNPLAALLIVFQLQPNDLPFLTVYTREPRTKADYGPEIPGVDYTDVWIWMTFTKSYIITGIADSIKQPRFNWKYFIRINDITLKPQCWNWIGRVELFWKAEIVFVWWFQTQLDFPFSENSPESGHLIGYFRLIFWLKNEARIWRSARKNSMAVKNADYTYAI